jgi:ribosomal protein S6--L-glutamate ligase
MGQSPAQLAKAAGQEDNCIMRIGILSRNPALYSTRRLAESARNRGHQVQVIDTTSVAVHIGDAADSNGTRLILGRCDGLADMKPLPNLDAIIPRIGASVTFYGLAVVRQFEAAGLATTASSNAIAISRDKLQSLQAMLRAGLPIPRTAVIARPEALYAAVQSIGGLPAVVKLIRGTQGRGVFLVHHLATIAAILQRLEELHREAIVQEYIAEANGCDWRVIVVGDRCVAAMERRAANGEFRANLHRGGTAAPIELDAKTAALAVAAATTHGLAVAGVDLIPSKRGPLFLEINSSPGLEGIEKTTGVDVAGAIIQYVETAARKRKN